MSFLEMYIGAIILCIAFYLNGKMLIQNKSYNKIFILILTLFFSFLIAGLNTLDTKILHSPIKVIYSYIIMIAYYRILFTKDLTKSIIVSFISYLSFLISEASIAVIVSIIFYIINIDSLIILENSILINFLVSLFGVLIVIKTNKKLIPLIVSISSNYKNILLAILFLILAIAILEFRIPINNWKFGIDFLITMTVLLSFCIIGVVVLKQKSDIEKTTSMYHQLVKYSEITNNLLEDYRIVSHEHKNQLSIIRGMLENKNKEVEDYIDELLEKKKINKYEWIGELNKLPLSGLKGLINYKLMEMESSKININIIISKDLKNTKLKKLNSKQMDSLYSIIGVYLDNAIDASKNSKEKEVSLEMYKEKNIINIIIANTYTGKIKLDKLDDYGYTTKGKNHGTGLHIVKKIIEEDSIYSQNRKIVDKYYIQELKIDLSKIK